MSCNSCPYMNLEPVAGAYGMCGTKIYDKRYNQKGNYVDYGCDFMGKDNWNECGLYKENEEIGSIFDKYENELCGDPKDK